MAENDYYYRIDGENNGDLRGPFRNGWGQPAIMAEQAAEHYHDQCDGYEDSWPVVFFIFNAQKQPIGKFSVNRDFDPSFYASPAD